MIKNIKLLTKVSTTNFLEQINIFNRSEKKFNKKSIYFWMFSIILGAIFLLSNKVLKELHQIGQTEIFLNMYTVFIFILMFFQSILTCNDIFYFSNDIETLIQYPIKPIELLFAKLNTLISILYGTELVFMLLPMTLYGLQMLQGIGYFISLIIAMMLLPIFIALTIGLINLFLIKLIKLIKNRDLYKLLITSLLIIVICIGEYFFIKNTITSNTNTIDTLFNFNDISIFIGKSTLILNPIIGVLRQENIFINIIKILGLNITALILFTCIGNRTYFKSILETRSYNRSKKDKTVILEQECKRTSISKAYIKNEWKCITGNSIYILQYVFPVIILIAFAIIASIFIKVNLFHRHPEILEDIRKTSFSLEGFCIILCILQVLYALSNLSKTAISRYGKNAIFMKYIPIDLYKQFWLKNILQIIFGSIITVIVLGIIKMFLTQISNTYIIALFVNAVIINILNSTLMLIVDIKRPIINWENEYMITKQNSNQIFQYSYTIIIDLLLMYMNKILGDLNINVSIIIITMVLTMFVLIVDRFVKNQIRNNKLFSNIN